MSSRIAAASCLLFVGLLSACVSPRPLRETSPVRIGMYADLSTAGVKDGTDAVRGADLRVVQANAAGGVGGRSVELVIVDVKQSSAEAVKAYAQLAQQEGVCAVIGAAPAAGLAVSPVAELSKVPLVSLGADDRVTLPDLAPDAPDRTGKVRSYSFLVQASTMQTASALAAFAASRFPAFRYATMYDPVNPASVLQARAFESMVRRQRREVAASVALPEGDLAPAVAALRTSGAEAVYVCASPDRNAAVANAVRPALPSVLLLGNQAWGPPLASAAGAAANEAWFSAPYSPDDPSLAEIAPSFSERFGDSLRPAAAAAWDAVGVVLAAVRKAGTSSPSSVRDALEQASGFKVLQGTLDMDRKTHRPLLPAVAIMRILDGTYRTENPRYVYKPPRA